MCTTGNGTVAATNDPWETGDLGQSDEHVRVATEREMREVDDALEL